jgi:hypothetical protein
MNANKSKYEALWNKLENDLLVGQDSYPKTIGDAVHPLTDWKASTAPNPRHTRRPSTRIDDPALKASTLSAPNGLH